jgi:hypothetical protein
MTPEEKARLVDETVDLYESAPDSELEDGLEKAQLLAKTFEALLSERRQKREGMDSDIDQARSFILDEMKKARLALREMSGREPEILTPDDLNRIVVPKRSDHDLRDSARTREY